MGHLDLYLTECSIDSNGDFVNCINSSNYGSLYGVALNDDETILFSGDSYNNQINQVLTNPDIKQNAISRFVKSDDYINGIFYWKAF